MQLMKALALKAEASHILLSECLKLVSGLPLDREINHRQESARERRYQLQK